jgi:RNA polymerase sigma factor (sigma-70 family)
MAESTSVQLQHFLDRLRAGDAAARDELLAHACETLRRLTRKMLRGDARVRRWEDTGDVLQNALLRLCRALRDVAPPTVRDFYRLAALQIRRELIDLARRHYGARGVGAHHASVATAGDDSAAGPPAYDAADHSGDPRRLALWSEFHRAVEAMPDDEREVFDLLWYQGLTQVEAAAVIGVTDRTVKSRWRSARLRLHEALGGQLPE